MFVNVCLIYISYFSVVRASGEEKSLDISGIIRTSSKQNAENLR